MKARDFTEKEKKWIDSFKRLIKKAPDSIFMFVGSGSDVEPNFSILPPFDFDGGGY